MSGHASSSTLQDDDHLTVCQRVNMQKLVVKNFAENMNGTPTVPCRIEKFGNVIETFSSLKRKWVKEMGFGIIFAFVDARLPRNLCYWLAYCVDVKNKELVSSNGVRFPLSKIQIHWVLGLPLGHKKVPKEASKCKIDRIWDLYGTKTSSGKRRIEGKTLVSAVTDPDVSEAEFKRAFLMFALNEVLCPTQFYGLSSKLLPTVVTTRILAALISEKATIQIINF